MNNYFGWKVSSVSVRTTDHLPGLSGTSTITVKLSQDVIIVSASCSDLKMCAFFHALYLCVSSILTTNSEYLRDINNRQVSVMGTENKICNTVSVSRANKRRHFLCAVDTALLLLGLQVVHWSDVTRLLRVMLVVQSVVTLVTYVSGVCAGHTAENLTS